MKLNETRETNIDQTLSICIQILSGPRGLWGINDKTSTLDITRIIIKTNSTTSYEDMCVLELNKYLHSQYTTS